MKITSYGTDKVTGTLMWKGVESPFTALMTGEVTIGFTSQGPPGFAVLDYVRELEGHVKPLEEQAPPKQLELPVAPPAEPAPKAPKAKAAKPAPAPAPEPVAPEPTPLPVPDLMLNLAPTPEELDALIEGPTGGPAVVVPATVPAPAAAPAPLPPVAGVAVGTEAYAENAESTMSPELWNDVNWLSLAAGFVAWCFQERKYAKGATLDSTVEDVVQIALKVLPTMPIARGSKPNTFSYPVLKTMLAKHVRAQLAALGA